MSHHLTGEQIQSFEENGYLTIESLLEGAELKPLEAEYAQLLNRVAADLHGRGLLSTHSEVVILFIISRSV